jgi:hypothetical protein
VGLIFLFFDIFACCIFSAREEDFTQRAQRREGRERNEEPGRYRYYMNEVFQKIPLFFSAFSALLREAIFSADFASTLWPE